MPVDITEPQDSKVDEQSHKAIEPTEDEGRADDKESEAKKDEGRTAEASAAPSDPLEAQPPKGLEQEHKALRDAWLKKNSEAAEKIQSAEAERTRLSQELDRKSRLIEELALKSNPQPRTEAQPEPIPEFQDMNQLTRYVEDRAARKAEALVETKLQQINQKKAYEDRWSSGWNTVAEKDKTMVTQDPDFQTLVKNELMNPQSRYLKLYTGQNEAEVIQKVVDGLRSVAERYAANVKQEVIADMKRKAGSGTERPAKSVTVGRDPKTMTKAEILAELRAEKGALDA